jgi:hypothetical protein
MATAFADTVERFPIEGELGDDARAIGGARFDAFFFWGAPLIALLFVWLWASVSLALPEAAGQSAVATLVGAVAILTFAHLIAVVPRAYFNREVFASNRLRLTIVPVLLIAGLALSPAILLLGAILAVFWDVHHSAMQTFGLARIYEMKAGNDAHRLRRTDLILNWALYVGPIAAGASLLSHVASLTALKDINLAALATAPGVVESHSGLIAGLAIAAWCAALLGAAIFYRIEMRRGYRMPVHKAALLLSTGAVSIAAWGFAPPFMAFAAINLFHAVQYFAIVWLKEGGRISERLRLTGRRKLALALFVALCGGFGVAYYAAQSWHVLMAPFIACSLLHFWYDSFVWSVRKKQV